MQTDQLQDTSLKTFRWSQIARRRIPFVFSWHKGRQASFSKMPFHYVLQHLFVVRYIVRYSKQHRNMTTFANKESGVRVGIFAYTRWHKQA